jgi:predicted DNA-binding transcriptional regulator AlpA
MPLFQSYVGIDYSGAQTPTDSLPGLCIYRASPTTTPQEVGPPPSPRKYWTRREIAAWLVEQISVGPATLVGIDHGFSFPLQYFERHGLPLDWHEFLVDFRRHWPTDEENMYVCFIREGYRGNGAARSGDPRWRRITELHARTAKSVFQFNVTGSVAHSTHAGLPWLLHLRKQLGQRLHFWPFDGWAIPSGVSAIAEVYPALWKRGFPSEGRTSHQQDAFAVAEWMRHADTNGSLTRFLCPTLEPHDRSAAEAEGWILGVEWELKVACAPEKRLTTGWAIVNDHVRMKIYSNAGAAKELGMTPSAITKYVKAGKIPKPKMIEGSNTYLWTEQDVQRVRELLPKIANGRKTRYQKLRGKRKAQAGVPVPHKKPRATKKK